MEELLFCRPSTNWNAGHKTLRECTAHEGFWKDFSVLAEVKAQHETQMELDRLTRSFLQIGRDTQRSFLMGVWWNKAWRGGSRDDQLKTVGALLYDRMHYDGGFDRFLDPHKRDAFHPLNPHRLADEVEIALNAWPTGQAQKLGHKIAISGVFPKTSKFGTEGPYAGLS